MSIPPAVLEITSASRARSGSRESPPLKVLIDCSQITLFKAGVGVYALNLIRQLVEMNSPEIALVLLVQDDDPDFLEFENNARVIPIQARYFRKLSFRFLLEQFYIPWLARKEQIDLVHSLHYSFPIAPLGAKKLVTVHDMTFFLMPAVHLAFKVWYFRAFIWASSFLADGLIFVSASTRTDYEAKFRHEKAKGKIISLGVSQSCRPDLNPVAVRAVLQKYELRQPYILYIGTIEPRKNLVKLVEAFALVAESFPEHVLVIAGKKGWMYDDLFKRVAEMNLASRVIFPGFVAEDDKPFMLTGAEVFAYPSLYEGFGIPILEAMACGVPTITSNTSSLPEVAGDGALFIDPESTKSIAEALTALLSDDDLRKQLSRRAVARAELFTWEKTAAETLKTYLQFCGGVVS